MESTVLLIIFSAITVFGIILQNYRVKLKTRYILTITLSTVLFVIYISLPDLTRYGREARIQHVAGRDKVANLRKIQFHESIGESKNLKDGNSSNSLNLVEYEKLEVSTHSSWKNPEENLTNVNRNKTFYIGNPVNQTSQRKDVLNTTNIEGKITTQNPKDEHNDDDLQVIEEEENDSNNEDEDEEYDEGIESPKRNASITNTLARAQHFAANVTEKDHFLYQLEMTSDDREKYFFDNYRSKKLLIHLSPIQVKTKLFNKLTWWELVEIVKYPRVWYVGENAKNKLELNESNPDNFGFDKRKRLEGGIYKIIEGDHLEYRYEILKRLGAGSFGSVVEARDHALSEDDHDRLVAIKIMHNDSSSERYFKKEIGLMKMIYDKTNGSERFSTVLRTFFFRNHLCYVMELLNVTVEDTRHDQPIADMSLLKKYASDVFNGLAVLHKENIFHGDLKPENLMLIRNCSRNCPVYVKLVDFSLSCIQTSKNFRCSPGTKVQTRLYRSPEIILGLGYPVSADIWSAGVILAELYTNQIPFYGESNTDQLAAIMEVLGLVPPYMVEESHEKTIYQKAVCYTCKNGFKRLPYRKTLQNILKGMPEDLYDLIKKCLVLDYRKRMTASEALKHRFLTTK